MEVYKDHGIQCKGNHAPYQLEHDSHQQDHDVVNAWMCIDQHDKPNGSNKAMEYNLGNTLGCADHGMIQ